LLRQLNEFTMLDNIKIRTFRTVDSRKYAVTDWQTDRERSYKSFVFYSRVRNPKNTILIQRCNTKILLKWFSLKFHVWSKKIKNKNHIRSQNLNKILCCFEVIGYDKILILVFFLFCRESLEEFDAIKSFWLIIDLRIF